MESKSEGSFNAGDFASSDLFKIEILLYYLQANRESVHKVHTMNQQIFFPFSNRITNWDGNA